MTLPAHTRPVGEVVLTQESNRNFFWVWFVAVNASLLLLGLFSPIGLIFPIIGIGGALFSLILSRWLAIKAMKVQVIDPENFGSGAERELHEIVADLSRRAGLPGIPQVGVYKSPDMNAFATGASQKASLIAFSSSLIEKLPREEIVAVAAHEVAHIANRDMLATVLIQGVINSVVLACTLPINLIGGALTVSRQWGWVGKFIIWAARVVVAGVLLFIGSLITMAFSRAREFRADAMAARLVGAKSMSNALRSIERDDAPIPREQLAYAAFKIAGRVSIAEFLSTHPATHRRIAALAALAPQEESEG